MLWEVIEEEDDVVIIDKKVVVIEGFLEILFRFAYGIYIVFFLS